ncbi:MAG TPA: DUF58 domain-containing protein [Roseiflexaceae bacterium]|nr:DUF58 domain-containing protein [Roseiflexaceae bacterium]
MRLSLQSSALAMFSRNTLQGLALLLVLALLVGQGLLALICILLLLTSGMTRQWDRWSLVRVAYQREFSQPRAFPDDEVELVIRISNRKPLPLVALSVRDLVPANLQVIGHDLLVDTDGRQVLSRGVSLRWYESVVWRYRVRCTQRGAYRIGPAQIEGGDPFGFCRSVKDIAERTSLIVYPRLLPLDELGLPALHPLGDLRARQLIRDPLRTIGVRDYHPDDPLKDVHWTATARTGALQTRIYEPTTAREVAIFLDLDSFERYWQGIDEEQVERLISATATVAQAGLADGYAVGLYVNGAPFEFEQFVRLPPGRSPAQLERIMETLARLTPYSVISIARLLRATAADLPLGATLLLISAIAPEGTRAALLRQRERGRDVAWLYLGDEQPPAVPGVLVRHAPPRGDWRARRDARPAREVA